MRSASPTEPDTSAGTVATDSSIYYQSGYWNDLAPVQQHLNRRASGEAAGSWSDHLAASIGRTFAKADPGLRAPGRRVPGAGPAVRAPRRWRADRAAR